MKIFSLFLVGLILILSLGYFLFFSKIFKVKEIKIIPEGFGNSKLILEKINQKKFLKILPFNKIFFLRKKDFQPFFSHIPEIKDFQIKKDLRHGIIKIFLKKREEVLIWCQENKKCFLVDESGMPFKETSFIKGLNFLYVIDSFKRKISLLKKVAPESTIKKIKTLYFSFKEKLKIKNFIYPKKELNEIYLKTSKGLTIFFSLKEDFSSQIEALERILEEKKINPKTYLDLRSFPKIYYK